MFKTLVALAMAVSVAAFAPSHNRAVTRKSTISMSHFSKLQTELRDKKTLVNSLQSLGHQVVVEEAATVRGYKGLTTEADIVLRQDNGHDIGFVKTEAKSFELVTDLAYWDQTTSPETFLEKLGVEYALTTIKQSAGDGGYAVEQQKNTQDGSINVVLTRWAQ